MRRLFVVLPILLLLAFSFMPAPTMAQGQRCFSETSYCITGRFLTYWEQNGGLSVFGYPTTEAFLSEANETQEPRLYQYFERNIFELHTENSAPYDVLLSRLGDDILYLLDYDWQEQPRESGPKPDCTWFGQTQFNVCNQSGNIGFKSYWASQGLEFDGRPGKSYEESLALFGLPITAPYIEENQSGQTVLMQWFERARFEWYPNEPAPYQVLLGLLGNEYLGLVTEPQPEPDPQPEPEPTPDPNAQCANIQTPVDATINPNCVTYGASMQVSTYGWDAGQPLGFWITDDTGVTVGTIQTVNADGGGNFGGRIDTTDWFGYQLGPGNYNFVVSDARNVSPADKYQDSIAPFRVLP